MFETAVSGAGYGYGTQQVGPQGPYGNLPGQFGQPAAGGFGQPQFGGPAGGMAQGFGGYPAGVPQSALPLTIGAGAVPFQQIQPQFGQQQAGQQQFGQPQFGQPQFGQPQFGQPQFGQPQFGQPQFGQPQFGQPQFGQPQFGQPQLAAQQLGLTQPQLQVIPVVTPQGWFGLLLLATGQPLIIGGTGAGISSGLGQYPGYGYGAPQGMIGGAQAGMGGFGGPGGGYLPLQAQQQIPQQVQFGVPPFPGQSLGGMPIH